MTTSSLPAEPVPARALALVSGIVGVAAGLFLIGFFAVDSLGGASLGTVNDVLGVVQFATLAPVAWALGRRLPQTRLIRVVTLVAVVAMITFAVLGVLLVARVLTFEQQIGPVVATIVLVYGWLLAVNLVGHRTRTLPRPVTRLGLLLGVGLLVAMVLVVAGYVLPDPVGLVARYAGYGLGGAAWLGLPLYVLLLAALVFTRTRPATPVATNDHVRGAVPS